MAENKGALAGQAFPVQRKVKLYRIALVQPPEKATKPYAYLVFARSEERARFYVVGLTHNSSWMAPEYAHAHVVDHEDAEGVFCPLIDEHRLSLL